MGIRRVISCDVCNRDQAACNHWWCVWVEENIFHSCAVADKPKSKRIKYAYTCGAEHEGVLHNRWLTTGSLEIEMHPELKEKPVGLTEESLGCKKDPVDEPVEVPAVVPAVQILEL